MTEEQRLEHNRLFAKASAIVKREMILHERSHLSAPGWLLRLKLKRAIRLFENVLRINPENWPAMWTMGKAYQRLRDHANAFTWFERSYQVNPSHPDVAREASLMAMSLGRIDDAISLAFRALQLQPANHGLRANLALAYLLANRVNEAQEAIAASLAGDPNDPIITTIAAMSEHFASNHVTPPKSMSDLHAYWRKNRSA